MSSEFPDGFGIVDNWKKWVWESIRGSPGKVAVTDIEFEWKIPDFFHVEQPVEETLTSPEFKSFGVKWHIYLRRNSPSLGEFELFIGKNAEGPSDHWVYYTIGIKGMDGTVFKYENGKMYLGTLSAEKDNFFLRQFIPMENSSSQCHNTGRKLVLSHSYLLQHKKKIAANNSLVVFCNFSLKYKQREEIIIKAKERTENIDGISVSSQNMKDVFHKQLFTDLIITVKDEEFRSHKAVLAAGSAVFHAMLQNDMAEKRSGVIEITDCEPDTFREFLVYLYSGDVKELSTKRICGVYRLADKYDVQQLKLDCVAVMISGMNLENFCDIISLAIMHEESRLIESGTKFFLLNAKSILQSVQWQNFLAENPTVANELFLKKVDDGETKRTENNCTRRNFRPEL